MEEEEHDNEIDNESIVIGDNTVFHWRNEDLAEQVQFLFNIHTFAKKYDHCVITNKGPLITKEQVTIPNEHPTFPFKATQFVYSFFAFNAIYNIDWQQSVSDKRVTYFNRGKETDKISSLLDFIFCPEHDMHISDAVKACRIKQSTNDQLADITEDGRIRDRRIKSFRDAIRDCLNPNSQSISQFKNIVTFT